MNGAGLKRIVLLVVAGLAAAAGIWYAALSLSRQDALRRLDAEASGLTVQHIRLLDSELARFRLLPIVLGEYRDLGEALASPTTDAARRLDDKLGFLARETGAYIIYLVDQKGLVISASNAGTEDSFVGKNFSFRPYFSEALKDGTAEYYGAGAISGRPGLFLARRVGDAAAPAGVVVVKFEFDAVSRIWANDRGKTFVVDEHQIILAASDPSQVLTTLAPLSPEVRASIAASGQYRDAALAQGNYHAEEAGRIRDPRGRIMIAAEQPVAGTHLRLLHLLDTRAALQEAQAQAWLLALPVIVGLAVIVAAIWWRMTRAARAADDRRALEEAVAARTVELHDEMAERARAEDRYRDAREELAQANRLASVGSITAGLMHEINQPVATIRTLAENARHHLAANRLDRVGANLDAAVEVTARIGTITQEMRRFSRRGRRAAGAEPLDAIIAGALLLVGNRFRKAGVRLELPGQGQPHVLAERVRLEQVIVNLLQNAIDAVAGIEDPHVALLVDAAGKDMVKLTVADNGPGIDPALAKEIFRPFVTGKPDGLGLGLGIAQDIMNDLGGSLTIGPSPLGGAAFVMTVRRA
ncbi:MULTISPECIES: ATP-binding protein [unclassified Rhizobium]|uniref:sensor histidine kinase n=1 Tax=unclassified Rhizobium TaxID=2613769 RepID=UPI001797B241|nr:MULTISPECIES: ATP-binding protein [unclassified Rhizobium]MBB3384030.1 two-component system C4-dicarboxylate transport sensor histidine kinase DctB [Rhizobium sp. BK098]MBB3615730.1 two-component system C4-dicarboxylate transport sensor histidine kinase DctB [Rhizobium sp. BK609]MBB3681389.1 two-component system C4-dicarboxylate transport sensor histidine kinase DctB [Rhizobium sp. BK612]